MPSFFKLSQRKKLRSKVKKQKEDPMKVDELTEPIYPLLEDQLSFIKRKTGNSADVVVRKASFDEKLGIKTAVVYVEGISNSQSINEFLIQSIIMNRELHRKSPEKDPFDILKEEIVALGDVKIHLDWDGVFQSLMSGETIVLVDGCSKALSASTRGGEQRSIEEPGSQVTVRGPRDGFTESIGTNISLVRRRIQNPNLWVETMKIGTVTKTDVSLVYIKGIAKEDIVNEVRSRLKRIEIDSILESGYIEQLIEDESFTTFPTFYYTERPDIVAGNLLEGRVSIMVNGTPFALIAPTVFIQFFQSVEDYYSRAYLATSLRFLRILIFFISIIAPASYIAGTTFHQEMIPTQLLIAIAAQRETVPFPAFVEALIMEVAFEILREAGVRMPRAVGSAISIVGALVIGQAAVQAGIVSPAMVIIVAITAIANFATPSFAVAISARIIRFLFMVVAATFGFYGIILGILVLAIHLTSLRSFGVPYFAPLAPLVPSGLGDSVVRTPMWALKKRPSLIANKQNQTRMGKNQHPRPNKSRGMVPRHPQEDQE
ncbi:spore germination protein [Mesobacillus maritimus]|uniref:Spore germination protein n=1 Tax=Mesobacillus maritimus TaxID=1643336 RepID=A0ABS7K1G6_9BACI|nr:spore germination protein [Mesobacillus maritimus]MBY0095975.1 spore germination protein [Mesobacillus maritimus]